MTLWSTSGERCRLTTLTTGATSTFSFRKRAKSLGRSSTTRAYTLARPSAQSTTQLCTVKRTTSSLERHP